MFLWTELGGRANFTARPPPIFDSIFFDEGGRISLKKHVAHAGTPQIDQIVVFLRLAHLIFLVAGLTGRANFTHVQFDRFLFTFNAFSKFAAKIYHSCERCSELETDKVIISCITSYKENKVQI